MVNISQDLTGSALHIALAYAIFGFLWIFTTDQLVFAFVDNSGRVTQLQTAKGWVFVALSALVVYGLVFYGQRDLQEVNTRLDKALQQTSILHRILRHNLRNSCNIIQGNADLAASHVSGEPEECLETIKAQNEQLIELSEQSRQLRKIVLETSTPDLGSGFSRRHRAPGDDYP